MYLARNALSGKAPFLSPSLSLSLSLDTGEISRSWIRQSARRLADPDAASLPRFRISAGFRSAGPQHPPARSGRWTGAGTIVRRRLRSIRRRARFDKSNTRGAMRNVPYERERVRKTERATRTEQACLSVCLSACLPTSWLPCLVRRRTARGLHVVCLASGLFTC